MRSSQAEREFAMLVLSRKDGQQIVIGEDITVSVVRLEGNRVQIGIDAPQSVRIVRRELVIFDDESRLASEREPSTVEQKDHEPTAS